MRLEKPRLAPLSDEQIDAETRERLGKGPILNIFRTLVRSPDGLRAFLWWGGYVLSRSSLSPRDREIVVHCKTGVRSAKAIRLLQQQGYTRLRNLEGGILAWVDAVDPTLSRY